MQRAFEFLKNNPELVLATSENNLPHLRVFQIMKMEENRLYFATSPEKSVWRELQANPNVEVLARSGDISVRCTGMVCFKVDDETRRWIYKNNPVLPRLYSSYDKLEYFKLHIAEMDYYYLQPTPPVFKHFDLMTGETADGFVGERFAKK